MVEAVFIGTSVPLMLLLFLLRHSRPVFSLFYWGMLAFLLVYLSSGFFHAALGVGDDVRFNAVLVNPPFEEFVKALPLVLLPLIADRSFVPYYYIFGMAAGIGFAIDENLVYLIRFYENEAQSRTLMIVRSFSTCLMHGVATGLVGYLVTISTRKGPTGRVLLPILGWLLASTYHGLFNGLAVAEQTALAVILAFGMFVAFLLWMKYAEKSAPEVEGTRWG